MRGVEGGREPGALEGFDREVHHLKCPHTFNVILQTMLYCGTQELSTRTAWLIHITTAFL